jgi:hypothetical protein
VIVAGWVVLMVLMLGGLVSMHQHWHKEALIFWFLAIVLSVWLFPAIAGGS